MCQSRLRLIRFYSYAFLRRQPNPSNPALNSAIEVGSGTVFPLLSSILSNANA